MEFLLIRHEVVDSTSERAFAEIAAGRARHGDVHVARGQTAGRGRRGRRWFSPPDEGLFLSLVLLPEPPLPRPTALTAATALAVREAVIALGLPRAGARAPRLKWPNDVLVGEAKLCGILTESRGLDPNRPHFVVGIGVNVAQRDFPPALQAERPVTSLALEGVRAEPGEAEAAVLERLGERLARLPGGEDRLAAEYLAAAGLSGRPVRIETGEGTASGTILDLSLEDGIELRTAEGVTRRVPLEFVRSIDPLAGG